jgi:hypothetical protein
LLRLGLPRLQAIFIEQHLGVLGPHLPGLGAHIFIDLLPQFGIERGFIQAGEFASKLCAFDHTRHGNIVTRPGNDAPTGETPTVPGAFLNPFLDVTKSTDTPCMALYSAKIAASILIELFTLPAFAARLK